MDVFTDELMEKRTLAIGEGRLSQKHLADLRGSGLTDETIVQAGLVTVSAEAAEEYLGYSPGSTCLVFEYPGTTPCYRLKPERPLVGADGRKRKYLAARESGNRLYFPPSFIVPEDVADTDVDLIITEGEKKALKACQEGFKTLALPGVWSWRTSSGEDDGHTEPLEELTAIKWRGRSVWICFDSDAVDNPDVRHAEDALASELRSHGARVIIARLPQDGENKVGLDDFLVAQNADALREVLAAAKPPAAAYFRGGTFVPMWLAQELRERDDYIHAVDPDSGIGRLYVYAHGVYLPAGLVDNEAQELLGDGTNSNRISEGVGALGRMVTVRNDKLNRYTDLTNLANGMLDPLTGELHPHDPAYLSTIQHPVAWDPSARSDLLDAFLTETCGEWADAICELAGYLLVLRNTIKKLFILHGDTDTGKTTLMNLICAMVGLRHYASVSPLALGDRSRRFEAAQLEDRVVNFFDDLPPGRISDPTTLKILTGGAEYIRVERKGIDAYMVRSLCRMVFAANQIPSCTEKTAAWYGRLCIFPFAHQVPEDRKDPKLRQLFSHDEDIRCAMLVKAVEGIRRLEARGWKLEGSQEELDAYKEINDPVMAFIAERCAIGSELKVRRTDLRDAYERYCREHDLFMLGSARKFYDRVRSDSRFAPKRINGIEYFKGLALDGGGQ